MREEEREGNHQKASPGERGHAAGRLNGGSHGKIGALAPEVVEDVAEEFRVPVNERPPCRVLVNPEIPRNHCAGEWVRLGSWMPGDKERS